MVALFIFHRGINRVFASPINSEATGASSDNDGENKQIGPKKKARRVVNTREETLVSGNYVIIDDKNKIVPNTITTQPDITPNDPSNDPPKDTTVSKNTEVLEYFPREVFDVILLTAMGQESENTCVMLKNGCKTGAHLKSIYKHIKIDKLAMDNMKSIQFGTNYFFDGDRIVLGNYSSFDMHSINLTEDKKAKVNSIVIGINGGFIEDMFDVRSSLATGVANFIVDRNANYKSKFSGYTVSFDAEIGIKFMIASHLWLRQFMGVKASMLYHGDSDEDDHKMKITNGKHSMAMGRLGITLAAVNNSRHDSFNFHVDFSGKFKILDEASDISTNSKNKEIEYENTKNLNFFLDLGLGIDYNITRNLTIEMDTNYCKNTSVSILGANIELRLEL
jgi:hypothetical protein